MASRAKKPKGKPPRGPKAASSKKKVARKAKVKGEILAPVDVAPVTPQEATVKDEHGPLEPFSKSGEERIDRLAHAIHQVRTGVLTSSRTNRLLAGGMAKMAQKVIEEAAEVGIEAIRVAVVAAGCVRQRRRSLSLVTVLSGQCLCQHLHYRRY
jgi:hypothetical protein